MTRKTFPRRRKKLIRPRWQLKLTGAFVGLTVLAMMLQFLVLGQRILVAAEALEGPGGQLAEQVPAMLLGVLFASVALVVPLMTALGVLLTFRFAGPIHRIEGYLQGLARGEVLEPCRIRKGDELQSMCDAVNAVARRLQGAGESESGVEEAQRVRAAG